MNPALPGDCRISVLLSHGKGVQPFSCERSICQVFPELVRIASSHYYICSCGYWWKVFWLYPRQRLTPIGQWHWMTDIFLYCFQVFSKRSWHMQQWFASRLWNQAECMWCEWGPILKQDYVLLVLPFMCKIKKGLYWPGWTWKIALR